MLHKIIRLSWKAVRFLIVASFLALAVFTAIFLIAMIEYQGIGN